MRAILKILQTLSPAQLRALDQFMQSPYFVTHAGLFKLYMHIKSVRTALPEAELRQSVRISMELDSKKMNQLCHHLLKALEDFLAIEQVWDQKNQRYVSVVRALRQLDLHDESADMLRYAAKKMQQAPVRGVTDYQAEYHLQLEAYYLSLQQGRGKNIQIQDLARSQDLAFVMDKLRMACILTSYEAITRQNYDKGLLNSVLTFLKNHDFLEIPLVAVYYHGYHALQNEEDTDGHFQHLKRLLEAHGEAFPTSETHDLYLLAINYCIRRINQAQEGFYQEVFDLYQSGLRRAALLEEGVLSRWTYNNITMTGLRLGSYDWVRQFLHQYAPYLAAEHREAAFHFNLARYNYETGNFDAALQHLTHMEYDDVLHNLAAKFLIAKIYYAQDAYTALENQLDSIQIYLRRKKVLGYHKDNYLAILRFMRRLLALNPLDTQEVLALQAAIHAEAVLTERDWLLKQLSLLRST